MPNWRRLNEEIQANEQDEARWRVARVRRARAFTQTDTNTHTLKHANTRTGEQLEAQQDVCTDDSSAAMIRNRHSGGRSASGTNFAKERNNTHTHTR